MHTVQTSGRVNVYHGRPADLTQPDVSASTYTSCPFHGPVTSTCGHLKPVYACLADCSRRFLAEQWSAASLTVAVSTYLRVASATSHRNRLDRRSYNQTRPSKSPRLWLLHVYKYLSFCSTSSASISTFDRTLVGYLSILNSNSMIARLGNSTTPIN